MLSVPVLFRTVGPKFISIEDAASVVEPLGFMQCLSGIASVVRSSNGLYMRQQLLLDFSAVPAPARIPYRYIARRLRSLSMV
jgi:hypothetical protein